MPTNLTIPFARDELRRPGPLPPYTGNKLREIAFPLGGIGTGTVSLGGGGELRDWEIFNRPDKGRALPYAFFTLRAQRAGDSPLLKVLQAPPQPPFNPHFHGLFRGSGFGVPLESGAGLPHLRTAVFHGEYPLAWIEFSDPDLPVQVALEAWNPTIPHHADDSGIPVAIFQWTLTNPGDRPVAVTLVANLPGEAPPGRGELRLRREAGLTALQVLFNTAKPNDPSAGSIALSTTWPHTTAQTNWNRPKVVPYRAWFESLLATGRLSESETPTIAAGEVGSLGLLATLAPGTKLTLPVFFSWSFPVYELHWKDCGGEGTCQKPRWRNYYAGSFPDAWSAARYTADNLARLEAETRLFHEALFDSTLPAVVLEAISSQMSIIKSTTCLRLPDGTFYGYEGCMGHQGCCEGSCTHVWNYAQTHAFLFPDLERSMREAEYRYSMFPDGKICFRLQLPLGEPPTDFHACADGQMGAVMQVYRDWQLGAGDGWLRAIWPKLKQSLGYAWIAWDADRDGLMEGIQHNTYDAELHGPNPLCGVMYLGALRAAARMADHLGETAFAAECRAIESKGAQALDAMMFNGEYYEQPFDPDSGLPHQVGRGCLIDQVFGQQLAHLYGLGYLLPDTHVRRAVAAVYHHNFKTDFWLHPNTYRVFALNDEAGTLICTWPRGGRPPCPLPYCDEVMIGFEYQLASHLIYEGLIEAGLAVTKAIRDRHDGERRNPWNEFECGNHYARSLANWAVKLAFDGFTFAATEGRLGFAPKINADNYRTFWSTATAWGRYVQQPAAGMFRLEVLRGSQTLRRLDLADLPTAAVTVTGPPGLIAARVEGKAIVLAEPVQLVAGETLRITS